MADRRVVKVSGLPRPQNDDDDLIKDKVLIHFLQRSNGGCGEVSVHYPTEEDGVALLEFTDEKVANRVLSHKHNLLIDDCSHPLEVRRPQDHDSQFSMPITTHLDLFPFRDTFEVKRILERHRLCIYHQQGLLLHIRGDFCDLGRCRSDLYKILREEDMEAKFSSLKPTGRKLLSEEMVRRSPQNVPPTPERRPSPSSPTPERRPAPSSPTPERSPSSSSPTPEHRSSSSSPTPERSPSSSSPTPERRSSSSSPTPERSPSSSSPTPERRPSPSSPTPERRPSPSSPTPERRPPPSSRLRGLQPEGRGHLVHDKVTRDTKSPTHHSSPKTGPREASTRTATAMTPTRVRKASEPVTFHVDAEVCRYVHTFKGEVIATILTQNSIDINKENHDGYTIITLTPPASEEIEGFKAACDTIKTIFDNYHICLQAENIELSTDLREEMIKMRKYLHKRHIYSFRTAPRSLKIIGPSEEILNFLQEWKGIGGKVAQRNIERNGSPQSSTIGKNMATNSKTTTHPGASNSKSIGREHRHDTRGRQQDTAGSSGRRNLSANRRR